MPEVSLDVRGTLARVIEALEEEHIEHAFIGAFPVLAWGRIRATTEIDLVVSVNDADWSRLANSLSRRGVIERRRVGPTEQTDSLPDIAVLYSGDALPVRIDLYIAKTDFERDAIRSSQAPRIDGKWQRRPDAPAPKDTGREASRRWPHLLLRRGCCGGRERRGGGRRGS